MRDKGQKTKAERGDRFKKDFGLTIKRSDVNIEKFKYEKRFYYKEKTIEEQIISFLNASKGKKTLTTYRKMANAFYDALMKDYEGPIRTQEKYYKAADISFLTSKKHLINGSLQQVRFIIDTTTTVRDRQKSKAQDALVYKQFDPNCVYIIGLPDKDFFKSETYKNEKREINNINNEIYRVNFANLYKNEGVDLVVKKDDIVDLLKFIEKNENKDITKAINKWKNKRYPTCYKKRKEEIEKYKKKTIENALKKINKELLK